MRKNPLKIVHADDEAELRELLIQGFDAIGIQVLSAKSGNEALRLIESQTIDLVITDCQMPDGTGIDLLKKVSQMNLPRPKVIMTTGFSPLSPKEIYALGAVGYFSKPFSIDSLFEKVDSLFPGSLDHTTTGEETLAPARMTDEGTPATIFMTEDDPDIFGIFKLALEKSGMDLLTNVELFEDGEALVRYLDPSRGHRPPDAFILDLQMPKMDGFEVLKMVRSKTEYDSIPVLILTGSNSSADRKKSYSLGANHYYTKPQGFESWTHLARSLAQSWVGKLKPYEDRFSKIDK